ncbi:MAG: hypothetical protein ACLFMU_00645 [Bacteroidales bacterium]
MNAQNNKSRENKLRRELTSHGLLLRKSRRKPSSENFGGYMIREQSTDKVLAGKLFDLKLADVENWFKEWQKTKG